VASHTHDDDQARSISRRRIVRSTATMAWAVPAITVASAAPAFAGVSPPPPCCNLVVTGTGGWRPKEANYLDFTITFMNGCATAVNGLTLSLRFCDLKEMSYYATDGLPTGWTQGGNPGDTPTADSNGCNVLTFSTTGSLAGNTSVQLKFSTKTQYYTGNRKGPAGTVTATVASGTCSSTPATIAIAAATK
jgi:hypothetical protein